MIRRTHPRAARAARAAAVTVSLTLLAAMPTAVANGVQPAHHRATAGTYHRVNLVSDQAGKAQIQDTNLVNPWGVSALPASPPSPLWVSDNGTDVTTLYTGGVHGGAQSIVPLVVSIPGGAPTGQTANPTTDFVIHGADGSSASAKFLFVGESGHLSGWAPNVPATAPPSTEAQDAVVTPGAVYKGLALGQTSSGPMLYAADFSAGTVDVYNGLFQRVITKGNFQDARLPGGFGPFNVAVLDGKVYVAYAKQDADREDEIAGSGLGRVDVFSLDGTLIHRLYRTSVLNAPWGLTIAPADFGRFSGDLLVGNFGDGHIHAFNPVNLRFKGTVVNAQHHPITIDGLWALQPGNSVEGGTDEVVFTAGPDDEMHGLLGTLGAN
jgi:uncharacterized protein (TIGR03118 family)